MNIYIICPVRHASKSLLKDMREYVEGLRSEGHHVHFPPDDVDQNDPTGKKIVNEHKEAMKKADEVHVFWDVKSSGSHFDLGMAFILDKKIVLVSACEIDNGGKSYLKAILIDEYPYCVEYSCGDKEWFDKDGCLHREDGPAVVWISGREEWIIHGERHRIDGPAIVFLDGTKEYWVNDNRLTEEEFKDYVSAKNKQV